MSIFFQQHKWINKKVDLSQGFFPHVILITTSFFVYLNTISPTIYWRDSPEFINVGYTLGIAHPSGSPFYSLISKIFTFIPLGSVAFKINMVSLVFAVCSVVILFKVILLLIDLCFEKTDEKLSKVSAIGASLLLLFSPSFWMNAVTAEVYTLSILGLCLIIYFSFLWLKTEKKHFLYLAVFFYGLNTGVHGGMFIFFPFLFLFFLFSGFPKELMEKKSGQNIENKNSSFLNKYSFIHFKFKTCLYDNFRPLLKRSMTLSLLFLLGFSVFIFLPIRSITNPTFDWGDTETFQQFVNHITDKKDSAHFFSDISRTISLTKNSILFGNMFMEELTLIGLMFGVIGLLRHVKSHKISFLLCFLFFFMTLFFYFSTTYKSYVNNILFLPSFIMFSFWVGLGIYKTGKKLNSFQDNSFFKLIFYIILSGFIAYSFLKNYNSMDKSYYYLAEKNAKIMYLSTKPNSIVFSKLNWFAYRYLKDVEGQRPDVTVLSISDLENPAIFNPVTPERFPQMKFPSFVSDNSNFEKFVKALIDSNIDNKHIYADFDKSINHLKGIEILPHKKFLARISSGDSKDKKTIIDSYLMGLTNNLKKDIISNNFIFDSVVGARDTYTMYLINVSDYLMLQNRYNEAEEQLKVASGLIRDYYQEKNIDEMLGVCYINLNNLKMADYMFGKLLKHFPDDYKYLYYSGFVNMKKGNFQKAKSYIEKSISLNRDFEESRSVLKQLNIKIDQEKL